MLISPSHPKIHMHTCTCAHTHTRVHAQKTSSWERKLRIEMSLEFVHILVTTVVLVLSYLCLAVCLEVNFHMAIDLSMSHLIQFWKLSLLIAYDCIWWYHVAAVIRNCPSPILSKNRKEISVIRGRAVPFMKMMNSFKKVGSFITIGVRRFGTWAIDWAW